MFDILGICGDGVFRVAEVVAICIDDTGDMVSGLGSSGGTGRCTLAGISTSSGTVAAIGCMFGAFSLGIGIFDWAKALLGSPTDISAGDDMVLP